MQAPSIFIDQVAQTTGARTKVLVVDDEPAIRQILYRWLTAEGYECLLAYDGQAAWELLQAHDCSLLISDIMMPGLAGMDLLGRVRESGMDLAVIMITGLDDRHTAIRALEMGAFGYLIKPFDQNEVMINVVNALERLRLQRARLAYEHELEAKVRERTGEIRMREEEIVMRLVAASEYRDDETGDHIRRMGLYAEALARALGWSIEQTEMIRLAAPMHDIGKIGIADDILLKPGGLTEDEYCVMKRHTVIGAGILNNSEIPMIQMAHTVALHHHEHWDGSGYPHGLAGEDIPLAARIVAFADVYDALMTNRVYRAAYPEDEALAILAAGRDNYFDPTIYDCAAELYDAFRRIRVETPLFVRR